MLMLDMTSHCNNGSRHRRDIYLHQDRQYRKNNGINYWLDIQTTRIGRVREIKPGSGGRGPVGAPTMSTAEPSCYRLADRPFTSGAGVTPVVYYWTQHGPWEIPCRAENPTSLPASEWGIHEALTRWITAAYFVLNCSATIGKRNAQYLWTTMIFVRHK